MFHSVSLLSQAPLARWSCALPSVLLYQWSTLPVLTVRQAVIYKQSTSNKLRFGLMDMNITKRLLSKRPLPSVQKYCLNISVYSKHYSVSTGLKQVTQGTQTWGAL